MNVCKYITFLCKGNVYAHMNLYVCKTYSGGVRKGNNLIFLDSPEKKIKIDYGVFFLKKAN